MKVILSGMSTMQQVEDNLKTFIDFSPLSDEEENKIKAIVKNCVPVCRMAVQAAVIVCLVLPALTFRATSRFGTDIICIVHTTM